MTWELVDGPKESLLEVPSLGRSRKCGLIGEGLHLRVGFDASEHITGSVTFIVSVMQSRCKFSDTAPSLCLFA